MKEKNKKTSKTKQVITYPAAVVAPVGVFLKEQLSHLKHRRREVSQDDPFKNTARATDNAAPDADAEEQFGHARSTAIKGELDRKIIQTRRALSRIKLGKYGICESCGKMIDTDRLIIYPEATKCVSCEAKKEKKNPEL